MMYHSFAKAKAYQRLIENEKGRKTFENDARGHDLGQGRFMRAHEMREKIISANQAPQCWTSRHQVSKLGVV